MRFIDQHFPLIVTLSGQQIDAGEMQALSEGFEKYFARGERYAVLNLTPPDFRVPDHAGREQMARWVNHPRVRDFTKRLCVGGVSVNGSVLYRVAFNVVVAFQKPAAPLHCVATLDQALEYCFGRIRAERLPTPKPLDMMRYELIEQLKPLWSAT
jgi:hypothetical protein